VDSIVGFTLMEGLAPVRASAALAAQRRVVESFQHLRTSTLTVGRSRLEIWGHGDLSARTRRLEDGSVLAVVGSPHGRFSWSALPSGPAGLDYLSDVDLPWEGRVILLKVSADGRCWTAWGDWVGSIPVFHARVGEGRVASTLEPVAVKAGGFSASDIFLPALLSLLVNGHTVADWGLYRGLHVAPADSVSSWDETGFQTRRVWAVRPTEDLAEWPWNTLVDRLHEESRDAVRKALDGSSSWSLALSSGLDSRLIAGVCAGLGLDGQTYAWGTRDTVDVIYSRDIAKTLGLPWTHVDLGTDYLDRFTEEWAAWFGSSLHFHGMYQMAFFDAIEQQPPGPILSGFLGDVLYSSPLHLDADPRTGQLSDEWHTHWTPAEVRALLRSPVHDAFEELGATVAAQFGVLPGTGFKRAIFAELWNRQRLFTAFQTTVADYWRGVRTPYLNRRFARFCLSLPRPALEHKRLLCDVYRQRYPRVAAIPGTYGPEPLIRTGRYLLKRRLASLLPWSLQVGPLRGFRELPPRMDIECVQANGWKALWPIAECRRRLSEWLDLSKVDEAFAAVMSSKQDMRPLRKLQSIQVLAYRLLDS
jgi:hypothetical protein